MSELRQDVCDAIVRELLGREGCFEGSKDSTPWKLAALGFDAARVAGLQVPTGAQILDGYGTTLGPVIFPPRVKVKDSPFRLALFTHECRHGKQWWKDPARMPFLYLGLFVADSDAERREPRAGYYESEAYLDQIAVLWALTGDIPERVSDLAHGLVYGYDLAAAQVLLAQDLIEVGVTSVANGVIPPGPARTAIALVYRDQPDALHPESLALIRANCPEALVLS